MCGCALLSYQTNTFLLFEMLAGVTGSPREWICANLHLSNEENVNSLAETDITNKAARAFLKPRRVNLRTTLSLERNLEKACDGGLH